MSKRRVQLAIPVLVTVFVMLGAIVCQQVSAVGYYTLEGYVKPDFEFQTDSAAEILSGFGILCNFSAAAYKTNDKGYFKVNGLSDRISDNNFWVRKPGYLTRRIENLKVSGNSFVSSIEIWPGDFNGDRAINMADIIELAKYFNTETSSADTNTKYDVNKDNAINMFDVILVVKNFNKTDADYPDITCTEVPAPDATPNITP